MGDDVRDETGRYDPKKGRSLFDDLLGVGALRLDAFPPHCLTISGLVSLLVGGMFLLGCVFNVALPHYERIAHSVQTRCKIVGIRKDDYIDDALFHYYVKYPLPGIPGLREGETYCYGSQPCSAFEKDSVHDCYFNTDDHSVRLYTEMSGHRTIRLFSYILLMIPFLFGALCCLVPASLHWGKQWGDFAENIKYQVSTWWPWKATNDDEYYQGEDYDRSYQEMGNASRDAGNAYASRGYRPSERTQERPLYGAFEGGSRTKEPTYQTISGNNDYQPQRGGEGGAGGGWTSSVSYMRMQAGL